MSGSEFESDHPSSGEDIFSDLEIDSSRPLPSTKQPERGRAIAPFITPWRSSLAFTIPQELEDDPDASDQERRLRQAAREGIERSYEVLSERMASYEKALLAQMAPSASLSVPPSDYKFTEEIWEELARCPKDHTFMRPDVIKTQLRAIPQNPRQSETTTTHHKHLLQRLHGANKEIVTVWLPKIEKLLSDQLRPVAYAYDILLQLSQSEMSQELLETAPEMADLLEASRLAFYQLTSARRTLAIEKMKIIGSVAGVEEIYRDLDEFKQSQNRELIDEKEYAAIESALKKRKAFGRLVNDKAGQVFGKGRSGGRSSSRGSYTGPSLQAGRHRPNHQGYQPKPWKNQHARGRGGWSRGRYQHRGASRTQPQQQTQQSTRQGQQSQ
jgi:hypothetical protein